MTVKVRIPTALRAYAGGRATLDVQDASTVREVVERLVTAEPALKPHLVDDSGAIRAFVNVYLNNEDVRTLDRERTRVKSGDAIILVPSVAGG